MKHGRICERGCGRHPFPNSDLSTSKRRPALVITPLDGDDVILCQITSRALTNANAIPLTVQDFREGYLQQESNIRPERLFTADKSIILYRVGTITPKKMQEVITKIVQIISA